MKTFEKLESLGFFDWLSETHNLRDTDMKPEYLDELPLNDIHRTVVNSMVFRWFRENYSLVCILKFNEDVKSEWCGCIYGHFEIHGQFSFGNTELFKTYEEAELACLDKLLEIVESKSERWK